MICFLFHVIPSRGLFLENKNKISLFGWAVNEKCDIFFLELKRQSGTLCGKPSGGERSVSFSYYMRRPRTFGPRNDIFRRVGKSSLPDFQRIGQGDKNGYSGAKQVDFISIFIEK